MEKRKKLITFAVLLMFIFLVQIQAPAQDYSKKSPGGMVEKEGQSPRSNHSKKKRPLWPYIIGGAAAAGIIVFLLVKKSGDGNSGPIISTGWGERGSGPGQFNRPGTVCLDAEGYVYVIDVGNYRIQKFDRDGKYIAEWSYNRTYSPQGMTVYDQKLYVGNSINSSSSIVILSLKLRITGEWPLNAVGGVNPIVVGDIAVDASGTFYITDIWNHRIIKLNHNGQVIKTWGSGPGSGTGQLNCPSGIMTTNNEVFVSDYQNYRIVVFDTEGNYRREWSVGGGNVHPDALALWGNDRLLVIRTFVPDVGHITGGSLEKYDFNGISLGLLDRGPGYGFASPAGLAVRNSQSKVYVSDYELHKIFVIDLY
jgi:tripartite motif-containing protein 71